MFVVSVPLYGDGAYGDSTVGIVSTVVEDPERVITSTYTIYTGRSHIEY